ncbi:MAG: hypothetical protein JWP92_3563, partial [Caulobacter sp.]|nr:hypothetical protein [Caulobacter sp.]
MIGRLLASLLVAMPSAAAAAKAPAPPPAAASQAGAPWSPDLGDPVLADLLVRAELGSLDVRMALARLERARAEVDLARAGRRSHLTIGAEAAVGGATFSSGGAGVGAPVLGSYEVDLFGRLKQGQTAATSEAAAALQDAAGARRLVLAEVARAYLGLRAAQARRAAAERRLLLAGQARGLIGRRQVEGGATAENLAAAQAEEATVRADVQFARHAVETQQIRLGLLLGQDDPIDEPARVDAVAPPTPWVSAVPSEAVLARSDIQAAQARLTAADARRAEAVAASRPRFMLTAGFGSGNTDLLYLLDVRALAWAVAGGLTHELLDGGAAKARKRGAEAEAQLAELAYRKAVGQAWGQARLGLAALQDASTAEDLASQARRRALAAVAAGRARHRDGDIDGVSLAALEAGAAGAD